jgi:hypothetical protein
VDEIRVFHALNYEEKKQRILALMDSRRNAARLTPPSAGGRSKTSKTPATR